MRGFQARRCFVVGADSASLLVATCEEAHRLGLIWISLGIGLFVVLSALLAHPEGLTDLRKGFQWIGIAPVMIGFSHLIVYLVGRKKARGFGKETKMKKMYFALRAIPATRTGIVDGDAVFHVKGAVPLISRGSTDRTFRAASLEAWLARSPLRP